MVYNDTFLRGPDKQSGEPPARHVNLAPGAEMPEKLSGYLNQFLRGDLSMIARRRGQGEYGGID